MKRRLRILYHHRTQGRGAESIHICSIVRALESLGHEVVVLGPPGTDVRLTEGQAPTDKSEVRTHGLRTVWSWISRRMPGAAFEFIEIGYNVVAWWRTRKALATGSFDVVYERYAFFMIGGVLAARRAGLPFLLELNEVSGIEERARVQHMPRLCERFERALFTRCSGIVAVSSYLTEQASRIAPDVRNAVVPNAVDDDLLAPRARADELLRQHELSGRVVLGFAGWFDDWDRLGSLVRLVAELDDAGYYVGAMLIGDGPQLPALRQLARKLGVEPIVRFTGPLSRPAVADHMTVIDIAVLPHATLFQSPMVLFEFAARGCAIVAPSVPGVNDVFTDGESVCTFPRGDHAALLSGVRSLLDDVDLRTHISAAATALTRAERRWIHNARRALDLLSEENCDSDP